jgi:hypothetical protein
MRVKELVLDTGYPWVFCINNLPISMKLLTILWMDLARWGRGKGNIFPLRGITTMTIAFRQRLPKVFVVFMVLRISTVSTVNCLAFNIPLI